MKCTTERNKEIFDMWDKKNMSFEQISKQPIVSNLSIQRIRNIIYGGPSRWKSNHEKAIYKTFRLKFLETQSVNISIWFTYANQPPTTICVRTVRNIINDELKIRNIKLNTKV